MDWHGVAMTPLSGGYSGETFLVGEGTDDEAVVRIYARHPERCAVDASLLRLLAGVLPVPRVLDERPPALGRPGVLVMQRLPGRRLDLVLSGAGDEQWATVGRHLGEALGILSGIPQLRFGLFYDADLTPSAQHIDVDGVVGWARHFRAAGRLAAWPDDDFDRLLALAGEADDRLLGATAGGQDDQQRAGFARVVLVHSDFNPKNILVDPDTLEVTGVLDWEFAHAGYPVTDLGNLLRFDRHPLFVAAVLDAYRSRVPNAGPDLLGRARAADLYALIELADRQGQNPVADRAHDLLLYMARTGDLHATPSAPTGQFSTDSVRPPQER